MRRFALVCSLVAVAGCMKAKDQPAPPPPAAAPAPAAPAPITLAAVAGKWAMRTMGEKSDSVIVTYELVATADTTGWTMTLPGRKPVAVRITSMAGDSIVTDAGPYASVLRKGMQVTVHNVMRMSGDKLTSAGIAHYSTKGADSLFVLRSEGSRAQ